MYFVLLPLYFFSVVETHKLGEKKTCVPDFVQFYFTCRRLVPRIPAKIARLASLLTSTTSSNANVLQASKAKSAIKVSFEQNTVLIQFARLTLGFGGFQVEGIRMVREMIRDLHTNCTTSVGRNSHTSTIITDIFANFGQRVVIH